MMESVIGKVVDNYRITGVLGSGGMGVVYKATELTLDRDVALKMMDTGLARDETFLKRFQSEAKALARLQNPGIVSIFALRETDLGFCIVMEYVDGRTLADIIKESGPLPIDRTLHIFKQILVALDYAHKLGIVHRDIKPGNIMLTRDDRAKVTDFGLAKIQQASAVTMTMGTGGTLYYMSPEQIRGLANVDQRGDIYSLGMTLYESVTGKVPFDANESDFAIRKAIVEGTIPPPDRLKPDLPRDLARIISRSIDKDVERRYQNASEMLTELESIHIGPSRTADVTRIIPTEPERPSGGRRPVLYAIAGIIVAAVILFLWKPWGERVPSTVDIDTRPAGADVILNGASVGATPLKGLQSKADQLSFVISLTGYVSKETTLTARGGDHLNLVASLDKTPLDNERTVNRQAPPVQEAKKTQPKTSVAKKPVSETSTPTGTLVLRAVPDGKISVDGVGKQGDSGDALKIDVASGERTVEFEHPQFGKQSTKVIARAGETAKIVCYFEVYASIQSLPVWGTLTVDGKNTGLETPQDRVPLGVGEHRLTVTRSGYETVEGEMRVKVTASFEEKVMPYVFHLKKSN